MKSQSTTQFKRRLPALWGLLLIAGLALSGCAGMAPLTSASVSDASVTAAPASPAADELAANGAPDGLTPAQWASVQEQIAQLAYQPSADDGGYVAVNPAHGFAVRFGADGLTEVRGDDAEWRIAMRLLGADAAPTLHAATDGQVTYQWSENLREWWVNDANGLEQWFEVARRPAELAADAPLRVAMALETNMTAQQQGDSLLFRHGDIALTYDKLVAWDATGRLLDAQMHLEGDVLALHVNDAGAAYPITIDPVLAEFEDTVPMQQMITYPYAEPNIPGTRPDFLYTHHKGYYGGSFDLDGDTLVVGSGTVETSIGGSDNFDRVHVFVRSGDDWNLQATLVGDDTIIWNGSPREGFFAFGFSVAISGDTIVVGDPRVAIVDGGGTTIGFGQVYVFVRSGTTWSQQAKLIQSNFAFGDRFGWDIDIDGDTIIVGASDEDSNATGVNGNGADNSMSQAGAAYIFTRSGTTWSQQAYLKASNTSAGDEFGAGVAISGDTVVVAAPAENTAPTTPVINGSGPTAVGSIGAAGAAYVFVRNGTTWSQQAFLKTSLSTATTRFAQNRPDLRRRMGTVAIDGDTIVVGQREAGVSWQGGAEIYVRSGTTWSHQQRVEIEDLIDLDNEYDQGWGYAVDIEGDIILVSGGQEASLGLGLEGTPATIDRAIGKIAVLTRSGTTWSLAGTLRGRESAPGESFGYEIKISGDTIMGSDPGEDNNYDRDGALFSGSNFPFLPGYQAPGDGDGDGVLDEVDACPDTPAGATVNSLGCPDPTDLSVVKTASVTTIVPGTPFDYTLTVTNNGTEAHNVVVVDDVPAGLTIQSTVASDGGAVTVSGQTVTATWDIVPDAAVRTLTITVVR